MTVELTIDGRRIAADEPPYIIAELSANHNGSLERALELIDAAVATGADAIKIQTYTADSITIDSSREEFKIKGGLWDGYTLHKLYQQAHTPYEWHARLFERARKHGRTIFSSPFDNSAIDLLVSLDAPAFKIASFEVVDLPLIAYAASHGKPLIISTGMANLGEISDAINTARESGAGGVALLHCVSSYPAPIDDANISTVPHLGKAFACVSGLSDHLPGSAAAIASVVLGGCIVEKHFTLARADGGLDAPFSLEPNEFQQFVEDCKTAWRAIGKVNYDPLGSERSSKQIRRSIFAVRDIRKGECFTNENVRSIRPGYGLAPKYLPGLLGKTASRDIAYGEPMSWNMIE